MTTDRYVKLKHAGTNTSANLHKSFNLLSFSLQL